MEKENKSVPFILFIFYRLTSANHPTTLDEAYAYDPVGNRLTDIQARTYTYNNGNELLTQNGTSFTYDANGNISTKTDTCGTTIYQYDYENRLIGISGFNAQCALLSASFKYDPFGRRIEKKITTGNKTKTTKYLYDREDILYELDASNNIITKYIHGPGIDEPLAMIKSGNLYYYHADGLGSITAITSTRARITQAYKYDSFGNITYMKDTRLTQPYTYTGREYDSETGLYYYRARYYDAKVGRFVTKDPIGFNGGDVNLFSYVGQNPVNYTDPYGLDSIFSDMDPDDFIFKEPPIRPQQCQNGGCDIAIFLKCISRTALQNRRNIAACTTICALAAATRDPNAIAACGICAAGSTIYTLKCQQESCR